MEAKREFESGKSIPEVIRELGVGVRDVLRSELRLLRAELRDSAGHAGRHAIRAAIFGTFALLGVLPFIAFLVVGLGQLLGGRYWLGALVVSILMTAVGGLLAFVALRKIRDKDLSMRTSRESIREDVKLVERKAREISETARRRAA